MPAWVTPTSVGGLENGTQQMTYRPNTVTVNNHLQSGHRSHKTLNIISGKRYPRTVLGMILGSYNSTQILCVGYCPPKDALVYVS